MIFALIQNGVIVNSVIANPEDKQDPNYTWIDITKMDPMPGIGWSYDGKNFISPQQDIQPLGQPSPALIIDLLNTAQISQLSLSPGGLVWNLDTNSLQVCDGKKWINNNSAVVNSGPA